VTLTVVVPTGAQSVDVALKAAAQDHADLTKTSGPVHVEAGQVLPTSDPRTQMTLKEPPPGTDDSPPQPNPARAATINGTSGIEVQFGKEAVLFVATTFTVAGKYVFSAQVEQGGTAWDARIQPATVTPPAGSTRQMLVHVRNNETAAGPVRFMVVRATKRNAADTADEFVSFVRFPVRGFTP
jgi:phage baseplate assembly protein W